jgi:transposase
MPLRPYAQAQVFLLPPDLDEWVRRDHPARIFSEIIDKIDTTPFRLPKAEGRPAYHPTMMLKVLLWGYATGVRSSRKLAERLQQDTVFMWLAGLEQPDFRTLCLFRTGNKEGLEQVFGEVIAIAQSMGMGRLGLVAVDGSKVLANSGIDSFKSVGDWRKLLDKTRGEAARIIEEAEQIDALENALHGKDSRGDELPVELQSVEERIRKIEELLAQAKQAGKQDTAKMSLTDPEASFMHRRNSSAPAYNAQLAVTEDQIIVHADVTTEPVDVNQIKTAVAGIEQGIGELPSVLVADAGYCGGENLKHLETKGIDAYIPEQGERQIGKEQRARPHLYSKESFHYDEAADRYVCPQGEELSPSAKSKTKGPYHNRQITTYRTKRGVCSQCSKKELCTEDKKRGRAIMRDGYEECRERMRAKLVTDHGRSLYGKRKCIVEPVIGQIKTRSSFNQFLLRGIQKVQIEWKIAATAHNLLKIIKAMAPANGPAPAYG